MYMILLQMMAAACQTGEPGHRSKHVQTNVVWSCETKAMTDSGCNPDPPTPTDKPTSPTLPSSPSQPEEELMDVEEGLHKSRLNL